MAEGFGLVIPDNLLSQLQEVDTKVAKLATESKNTASTFVASFSDMVNNGTEPLSKSLDGIISKVSKLGDVNSIIAQAADNINKMNNSGDGENKNIDKLKSQL